MCVYHFYCRVVTFSLKSADIKFQHHRHNCSLLCCCFAVRMWNVKSGQYGTVLIEHFALCHGIHAFV